MQHRARLKKRTGACSWEQFSTALSPAALTDAGATCPNLTNRASHVCENDHDHGSHSVSTYKE
jgi:hypothetical protein